MNKNQFFLLNNHISILYHLFSLLLLKLNAYFSISTETRYRGNSVNLAVLRNLHFYRLLGRIRMFSRSLILIKQVGSRSSMYLLFSLIVVSSKLGRVITSQSAYLVSEDTPVRLFYVVAYVLVNQVLYTFS